MPIAHLRRARRALVICAAITGLASPLAAQETVDLATIDRIKDEAMKRCQIMDTMSWLTDVLRAAAHRLAHHEEGGETGP